MSWDPFQRAVLAELGHELYRPVRMTVPGAVQVDDAVLARMARAAGLEVDDFARRFALSGFNAAGVACNLNFTTEAFEKNDRGNRGKTAWWQWTAPRVAVEHPPRRR